MKGELKPVDLKEEHRRINSPPSSSNSETDRPDEPRYMFYIFEGFFKAQKKLEKYLSSENSASSMELSSGKTSDE